MSEMKKILSLLLIPVLLLVSSCDNYLDIKPYGKTIPKTSEEFVALLHAILNRIDYGEDEVLVGNAVSVQNLECYAENLDASLTSYPAGNVLPIYIGSHTNQKQASYEKLYQHIRDSNIVINNLTADQTELDKNVLGTAYAIRGISYYQLMRQFCEPYKQGQQQLGVPLVRDFDMEARPLRSSLKETMDFIESDLTKALSYGVEEEVYRFTEDVVRAYLARFYFWTNQWDKVIPHAEALLISYPLLEGAAYTAMLQSKNTRQGNTLLRSYVFSSTSSDITYSNAMQAIKARPLSREFVELFPEKGADVRYTLVMDKKRQSTKNLLSGVRTDEMCLILAEAYAHKKDSDKALYYLNHLRSKRISNYEPYTLQTLPAVDAGQTIKVDATGAPLTPLMQAILNERRKELYGEGDRWFELKRNGGPEFWVAKDGLKYVTEAFLYTFPIPRIDVELINGLQQNPGYEG